MRAWVDCPFCGGRVMFDDVAAIATHTLPICTKFVGLDVRAYITAIRRELERQLDRRMDRN